MITIKKRITLTSEEIDTIKAMIIYMLTEDESKVDSKFIDKLINLENKFEDLSTNQLITEILSGE